MAPRDDTKNSYVPSAAIASLTDSSGGTAGATVAAIGATYAQDEVRNALASIIAKQNAMLAALRAAGIIGS